MSDRDEWEARTKVLDKLETVATSEDSCALVLGQDEAILLSRYIDKLEQAVWSLFQEKEAAAKQPEG